MQLLEHNFYGLKHLQVITSGFYNGYGIIKMLILSTLYVCNFKRRSCHHIETSQLICSTNQLIDFYMMATLAFDDLKYEIK